MHTLSLLLSALSGVFDVNTIINIASLVVAFHSGRLSAVKSRNEQTQQIEKRLSHIEGFLGINLD